MHSLFLVNPLAGKVRNVGEVTSLIQSVYQDAGQSCEVQVLDFDHLDHTLRQAIEGPYARIFAVGGDGTINAIGSRLVHSGKSFGIIPAGSGNGLGRHLKIPTHLARAIRMAPYLRPLAIDTGLFGTHPFINLAGIGLDAQVAYHFSLGKRRGLLPYVQHSAWSLLNRASLEVEIGTGDHWQHFGNVLGVTIANGTQWGFEAKIANGASLSDGLLDIRVIHRFPLIVVPPMLVRLFNGTLHHSPYITAFQAPKVRLRSSYSKWIQIDGEPQKGHQEYEVQVQPRSLQLLVPQQGGV